MRIAVHDYAGHPFVFDLTRALAARGHVARHFFFAGDVGPKGDAVVRPDDPDGFSIEPLNVSGAYDKGNLINRWKLDREYGATARQAIKAFEPEIILSGNTPLDAQDQLVALAKGTGASFVFWMQDMISPLIMRQLGSRWGGLGAMVARHYQRKERRQLEASDGVVLISDDFRAEFERHGIRSVPPVTIPNWGAIGEIPVRPRDNPWSQRHGLEGKRTILYSGTLGAKHSPLLLLDLADALADEPDVVILLASAGLGLEQIKPALATQPRANIRIEPLQPMADFPDVLGSADVLLALLETDAGRFCVPSKVLSYLCAGRPIVLSSPAANLSASILADARAGITVEAGSGEALIAGVRRLLADAPAREAMGRNGRSYAERSFDVASVAAKFEAVFEASRARHA